MPGEHKINTRGTKVSPLHTPSSSPPLSNGPALQRDQLHTMGTTTYTQPFKQGFAHATTTNTTTAPAVSKPWYASLDSLPESGKFNGGNINIPSQHCTSDDHQPKSSPQAQMRTRRFSNAEIERVIEEELEIADDIPAPWPLEFEEASPPNTIRKATRQEQDPLQFPLEVEAPSQVEKAGAWSVG
ncbi:hypothetical protein BTJ68_10951 [Hortaea werneckii EXF-2000]|uniref:Uncharacterized protein n=1 Tax=Hortaea werneckii EXF-2000 TaxID=1157616 RepID=A0A1Z5T487_HORWE|nr:hypothetical protein BTJ68_10951 [Hortaea werneckii EXF-2000]